VKTVITGVSSLRNRGVDALVTTTIEQLAHRLPQPSFLILDQGPDYDACHLHRPDTRVRFDETLRPYYVSRIGRARIRASRFVKRLSPDFQAVRQEIRSADLLCASGGDVFTSTYGHRSLSAHLAPLRAAREFARPYFLLAQSIGPFASAADREAFRTVARDAAGISVRERISYDYVTQDLGLPESLVSLTADPAFLLRHPSPARLAPLHHYYGCDGDRPLIALAPSQAICQWMQADHERHLRAWCAVIAMLLDDLGARIVLIPHVQEIATWNDDRILVTELLRRFDFDPRLRTVEGDYSAAEIRSIIGRCDLVVAERLHACIAALSSGVGAAAIKYSIKAEGVFRDFFAPQQIADGLVLTLDDFLDPGTACAKIGNAWRMRSAIEARLKERLPDVERRARLTFDLVAEKMAPM
jgi:colanic acid/amylovoran biosynthesis protein